MSEALQQAGKGPGSIIRRLSGKASGATQFVRRQSSSQNVSSRVSSRETSCGPVIVRRRSGSKVGTDLDEEPLDGFPEHDDLQPWERVSLPSRDPSVAPNRRYPISPRSPSALGLQEAPVIDDCLRRGSLLTKVTKRRRKQVIFVLDPQTARVSWKSSSKKFYVDDIEDILVGENAREFREQLNVPKQDEPHWLTIIVADRTRSKGRPHNWVHLIAPTGADFRAWTSTLRDLYEYRRAIMTGLAGPALDELTLEKKWQIEMERKSREQPQDVGNQSLDYASVERVCRSLHINCSSTILRDKFIAADVDKAGKLEYPGFRSFVCDLKERKDVKDIYEDLSKSSPEGLTYPLFLSFLEDSQKVDTASQFLELEALFSKHAQASMSEASLQTLSRSPVMDLNAFNAFLSSPENHILRLRSSSEKLDRPLNEYFISSSHNTYLLGRQFADISSTEGYRLALQAGCRCIEIDCWDGKGRPEVRHMHVTNSVLFSDCISVINKYAFERSPYPLILSLEIHCGAQQQQMMADIMKKEFGDRLVPEPLGSNNNTLPSPEELRHRILIKVKTADQPKLEPLSEPPHSPLPSSGRRQRSVSSPFSQSSSLGPIGPGNGSSKIETPTFEHLVPLSSPPSIGLTDAPTLRARSSISTLGMPSTSDESDFSSPITLAHRSTNSKANRCKIIEALEKMCIYTRGSKFHGLDDLNNTRYNHIYSLSEGKFGSACRDRHSSKLIEQHNTNYLMRTYPKGTRLMSGNFEPLAFWRRGVQMAAMNYQTYDEGMQMNEAMFASGGDRMGYVLKPPELRLDPTTIRPRPFVGVQSPVMDLVTRTRITLTLDIISAHLLESPRSRGADAVPNPYIEVQVYIPDDKTTGLPFGGAATELRDTKNGMQIRRRSKIKLGNGYNPSFDETFVFHLETQHPELVQVRFSVWNSTDGKSYSNNNEAWEAVYMAKCTKLNQGYRHVPLNNHNGEQFMFSTLFCKIRMEEKTGFERVPQTPVEKPAGRFRHILGKGKMERKSSLDDY